MTDEDIIRELLPLAEALCYPDAIELSFDDWVRLRPQPAFIADEKVHYPHFLLLGIRWYASVRPRSLR